MLAPIGILPTDTLLPPFPAAPISPPSGPATGFFNDLPRNEFLAADRARRSARATPFQKQHTMNSTAGKLILSALLGAATCVKADTTVLVDSTQDWLGYMNVYQLDGTTPVSEGSWYAPDLKAEFSGGGLILKACPINNPATPDWYVSAGGPGIAGTKSMEATYYVEKGAELSGQNVTFSGTVQNNTLASPYHSVAFIKDFAPDYSSANTATVPLVNGTFTVSLATSSGAGRHVQYGFKTYGPNVWPTDVDGKGSVQIVNVPASVLPTVPNGDFETPGGTGWGTTQGTPTYPATGGNPNGHAILDGTAGFAVLYAFNNAEKNFASLGLVPGDTFTVQMDMKLVSGINIGGLRLEGPAGYDDEAYPAIIGDGSQWATYSIELTVPASPIRAKLGLRPGGGSIVAFDNIKILVPGPLQATIAQGTSVSWTATSAVNQYQPQGSETIDGPWTDVGSPIVGNSVTSAFDSSTSPFYQVLQSVPFPEDIAFNGGFEAEGFDALEADGWESPYYQLAERITTGAHTGTTCMQIKVANVADESNASETHQNTLNAGGPAITTGSSYTLMFWSKQISSGPSYVQGYRVSWLAEGGSEVGSGAWQTLPTGATGIWTQRTLTGLVAPAGAVTAYIQIVGTTGTVFGGFGEVHIDDVSLVATSYDPFNVLPATAVPAVEISWPAALNKSYQVQSSGDLTTWANFGGVVAGDNTVKAVYDTRVAPKKFYKVGKLP